MSELAQFVEGRVVGVYCEEIQNIVRISLEDALRRRHVLIAHQVENLMVLEMRTKNIIDRISVWDENGAPEEYKSKLSILLYGEVNVGEKYPEYADRISDIVSRLASRDIILLEVEPVFGALILLLARRFEIVAQE